ncbi:MAG TPA: 2'-5' RNA ligase family protein [Nitrospiraceae bacterium]|nr:2'-5' RNA ligase family protein [Nitrospiraceae bacterium]
MNSRYHLWLKPSSRASDQFAGVIQQFALELDAPTFDPHITLLGNVNGSEAQHVASSNELARRLRPFPINVSGPAFGENYFHCVFLVAEMTPPLLHAHALACQIFHQERNSHYLPHLSLVYGRYSESRKKDIIAKLPASLYHPFEATHLSLIRAGSEDPKDWREVWMGMMGDGSEKREDNPG